jgi:hypothetical protein
MPPAPLQEGKLRSDGVVQQADGFFMFSQSQGTLVILVCWAIWQEQNSRIFEAQEKTLLWLLAAIKDQAMLWVTTIKTVVQQR